MIDLIGTPRYPLGHPGLRRVFSAGTGRPVEDDGLAALVRQMHRARPFMQGTCYGNTARLYSDATANDFKGIVPYGGWLLVDSPDSAQPIPIHHAWAVLGEDRLIDLSLLSTDYDIREAIYRKWWAKKPSEGRELLLWNVAWRRDKIEMTRPLYAEDPTQFRVWGVVPKGSTYIGCPCDAVESARLFRLWHSKYGKINDYDAPGVKSLSQQIEESLYGDGAPGNGTKGGLA